MKTNLLVGLSLSLCAGGALAEGGSTSTSSTTKSSTAASPLMPVPAPALPSPTDTANPLPGAGDPTKLPTAEGSPGLPAAGATFSAADANGDAKISRSEAKGNAMLSSQFGKLDVNGDGMLSKDEYKATAAATATRADGDKAKMTVGTKAFPKDLDTNSDGKLTKAEARKDSEIFAQFETIDGNDDGSISNQEYRLSTKELPPLPGLSTTEKSKDKKSTKDKAKDALN